MAVTAVVIILGVIAQTGAGGGILKNNECTKEHQWSMAPSSGYVQAAANKFLDVEAVLALPEANARTDAR